LGLNLKSNYKDKT